MEFNELTEEQRAKARACRTREELMELAKSEGVELTNEELDAVSGGVWSCTDNEFAGNCSEYYGKNNQ